jgi:hypothetical protein
MSDGRDADALDRRHAPQGPGSALLTALRL